MRLGTLDKVLAYVEDGYKIESGSSKNTIWLTKDECSICFSFYSNGNPRRVRFLKNKLRDAEGLCGPSEVSWYPCGSVESVFYHKAGLLHREDGPATLAFTSTGHSNSSHLLNGRYSDSSASLSWEARISFKEEALRHAARLY